MSDMQTIQWFPGHMTKTKRQIQANLRLVDAVAEMLESGESEDFRVVGKVRYVMHKVQG